MLICFEGYVVFTKTFIIKVLKKNGFSLDKDCQSMCIHGDYARNLQLVFSNRSQVNDLEMLSRLYVAVNLYRETLVLGLIREFTSVGNGVVVNTSRSIGLSDMNEDSLDKLVKKFLSAN